MTRSPLSTKERAAALSVLSAAREVCAGVCARVDELVSASAAGVPHPLPVLHELLVLTDALRRASLDARSVATAYTVGAHAAVRPRGSASAVARVLHASLDQTIADASRGMAVIGDVRSGRPARWLPNGDLTVVVPALAAAEAAAGRDLSRSSGRGAGAL